MQHAIQSYNPPAHPPIPVPVVIQNAVLAEIKRLNGCDKARMLRNANPIPPIFVVAYRVKLVQ